MAASVFDSALYGGLFSPGEAGRLFSDSAEIRAMLLVEGALAKVQGEHGVIPELSAAAISRAAMEVQIDPAAMAEATNSNGVSVPALVAAFRAAMQAPEHAQYVHWGATSQDIQDSALILRLRQALVLIEADLHAVLSALAGLAETHADLPMPARTYGQHATPTSFGAVAA
ncbi:3-carboxy-cis,cis-muconate cycloisomerase, partial [Pseudooceanicola lipolyticus]